MTCGVTVSAIVLSSFALDGGAMHGIVPRTLWDRVHRPDEKNRIALVARALLVDHAPSGSRTLIELGMGQRWTEKERAIYALTDGGDAPDVLREAGVDPDTVTRVVLTHAHWDHAGGLVRRTGELAFPRAEHVMGATCWAHARSPSSKDAGSFRQDDLTRLLRDGKLRLWREGDALAPGLEARLSNGHTEGLVIPIVRYRDDGPPMAIPTDLFPTRSHLKPGWVMSYDNAPVTAVEEKRALIDELAAIGGGILLYHDPIVEAAWVTEGPRGRSSFPARSTAGARQVDRRDAHLAPSDLACLLDGESVRVGGRVVAKDHQSILVADAFGTATIALTEAAVAVDDLVLVEGLLSAGKLVFARLVELHRPLSARASAGASETGRLLRDGVGARLRARATGFRSAREFFADRRFLEVDTPSIVPSPGLDLHLDAFEVNAAGYLITSPEYQMKRLLAGGVPRCFQLARCYRRGEVSARHNPEFVMIEWYRSFATMNDVIDDTEALVKHVLQAIAKGTPLDIGGEPLDVDGAFERLTVADAFARFAGVNRDGMLAMASSDEARFFTILVERVEPALARFARPVFLTEYPAPFASLARLSPSDPRIAERFELYARGVELCNGFGELTCPIEQRARLERDRNERARRGLPVYPIDERFLAALEEGMPPAAGNALGLDRLIAIGVGAESIAAVQAFPIAWLDDG